MAPSPPLRCHASAAAVQVILRPLMLFEWPTVNSLGRLKLVGGSLYRSLFPLLSPVQPLSFRRGPKLRNPFQQPIASIVVFDPLAAPLEDAETVAQIRFLSIWERTVLE